MQTRFSAGVKASNVVSGACQGGFQGFQGFQENPLYLTLSFIALAMNNRDPYKIIGLCKISHYKTTL